jgi:hypothetical protein
MTEDDLTWSKERIREALLANKLGVDVPWTEDDLNRMVELWTVADAKDDYGRKVATQAYILLMNQIREELTNERGQQIPMP